MTGFLWIMLGGIVFGLILGIISGLLKKQVGCVLGFAISFMCMICFFVDITVEPVKNPELQKNTVTYIEGVEFPEIYKAYKENELKADDLYKNNRYRITAKVNGMTNDGLFNITGGATLTMELKVDNTIVFFYAEFEKEQESVLKDIKVGDTITFEGKCLDAGNWADCKLIQ